MSLYDQSKGLSNLELENYFTKHNIPFNEVDSMNKLNNPRTKQSIVYTGTQPDTINNGVTKHWTYYSPFNKTKKELFDSYGDPTVYNQQFLNKNNINFVNRRQFQAFDTNVCGEYCAAWAKFLNEHPQSSVLPSSHLVEEFAQKHNLTKNRIQNDKNIREYYKQTA
jgi:hypothetical protein